MKKIISKINKIDKILETRKTKNKLNYYNKGEKKHKKQLAFHKSQKRNRWVFGGNRSGKTECGAVEVIWLARGIHPYRKNKKDVTGWVVSLSRQVQREVAQQKILDYLNPDWIEEIVMLEGRKDTPLNGVVDYILVKNVFGGHSKIGFKSCDQGREKFQGASLDFVWFDEEPPYDIYFECKMRVLDRKGEIFGTMTPLKGLTWVYKTIYLNPTNDKEVFYIFMEWADNPFLDKGEVLSITHSMSKEELESRRYGKFIANTGMVYNEFDENVNVIEPFDVPREWYDTISIDPGLHNPLSAHWYAQDFDGNIYVIAEHYMAEKTIEFHAEQIKKISDSLFWHRNWNGMLSALIDSAANQHTLASQKSVSELFYDNGILVNTNVNKDLFSGINMVKSYFKNSEGKSRLFIFKNCTNLIREIKSYYWGANEAPTKKDDHSLDELRYYIMSKNAKTQMKHEKTEIQRNKEMMIRKNKFGEIFNKMIT